MASDLKELVGRRIAVVTNDGRVYWGRLEGLDQKINLVLLECEERVYSEAQPVDVVPMGLFLVRGDNVAVVAEVDAEADAQAGGVEARAAPLKAIVH